LQSYLFVKCIYITTSLYITIPRTNLKKKDFSKENIYSVFYVKMVDGTVLVVIVW